MAEGDETLKRSADSALANAADSEAARNALAFLFPKFDSVLRTYLRAGSTDHWDRRRRRRISISDFAPAYFRMDPQHGTWPRSQIEAILNHQDPIAAVRLVEERLRAFDEQQRSRLRRLFLDELRALFHRQPITERWLQAIVEVTPTYIATRDEVRRPFVEDNSDRLRQIVYDGLRSLEPSQRAEIFLNVIPTSRDISLLCDLVRLIAGDIRPNSRDREPIQVTFGENEVAVRQILLTKIRQLAADGEFWEQTQPGSILWFWWGSNLDEELKHFTAQALDTETGVRALLKVSVQRVYSTAGDYDHVSPGWSQLVDIDRLAEIARKWLEHPNRQEDDRQLAKKYLAAYEHEERFP